MDKPAKFLILCIFAMTMVPASFAQDKPMEFGLRANAFLGDGTPANDILGYGIFGRYFLDDKWAIGVGLDVADFDMEGTASLVGLTQPAGSKTIDSSTSTTMLSAWIENQRPNFWGQSTFVWNAGLGFNSVSVDNASGSVAGGGTFNVKTDAGTETVAFGGIGLHYPLGEKWRLESLLTLRYHFANWKLQDLNSTATGTIGNYSTYGLQLGVSRSF